ncbi:MAG: glutathione S-transferase N-terminal domain-containing protein [Chromatiaceae bacterium]|nr:glutathione S-transferase N-terminal domain-containing protein [Chromatiaceae bacterium]MCP5421954.1 glutathione S-transferase N-terminal domain-containing protein [Chromatiaceae bacterium]
MIAQLIRWPIGRLILFVDALTAPRRPQRQPAEQARVDATTHGLSLYQFHACPFCVKTRRALRRLGADIELRNAKLAPWRDELLDGGGRLQVPCLRIPQTDGGVHWLYESDDIIAYLEGLVGDGTANAAA